MPFQNINWKNIVQSEKINEETKSNVNKNLLLKQGALGQYAKFTGENPIIEENPMELFLEEKKTQRKTKPLIEAIGATPGRSLVSAIENIPRMPAIDYERLTAMISPSDFPLAHLPIEPPKEKPKHPTITEEDLNMGIDKHLLHLRTGKNK